MALFLGLSAAQFFSLFDLGMAGDVAFPLFIAFVFVVGQPWGRRGWLVAIAAVLLAISVVGIGAPAMRWMAGGATGVELLAKLAALAIGFIAIMAVRTQSEPVPTHPPTRPKAWKPASS